MTITNTLRLPHFLPLPYPPLSALFLRPQSVPINHLRIYLDSTTPSDPIASVLVVS